MNLNTIIFIYFLLFLLFSQDKTKENDHNLFVISQSAPYQMWDLFRESGMEKDYTINLTHLTQPVYMGHQISPSTTIDSSRIQFIRYVFCRSAHQKEGETRSEGKHITFSSGTYNRIVENISINVDSVLQNRPNRFIGNVNVFAEVDCGISLGAIFSSILGSQVTGEDSEIGIYNDQSFYVTGTIYELREDDVQAMLTEVGFSEVSFTYAKGLMMPKMMIARGVKQ